MIRTLMIAAFISVSGTLLVAANDKPKEKEAKPAIVLPKDAKTVVLTYDPGAGGFVRKGEAPYLKIQADGQMVVTNLFDGTKVEGKLTAKELDELLKFVIQEKDFQSLTEAKLAADVKDASANGPFIAVGGAGTSEIFLLNDGKKYAVKYRAAATYFKTYPKAELLGRFVEVEKKLSELGAKVAKGK